MLELTQVQSSVITERPDLVERLALTIEKLVCSFVPEREQQVEGANRF
jgi:hypothetical protein